MFKSMQVFYQCKFLPSDEICSLYLHCLLKLKSVHRFHIFLESKPGLQSNIRLPLMIWDQFLTLLTKFTSNKRFQQFDSLSLESISTKISLYQQSCIWKLRPLDEWNLLSVCMSLSFFVVIYHCYLRSLIKFWSLWIVNNE